jgi:hypothetical protein
MVLLAVGRRASSSHAADAAVRVLSPGSNVSWTPGR